jgi:hypothetical protein
MINNNSFSSNFAGSVNSWKSFTTKAEIFIEKTQQHVLQGLNPGGVYQAIWCRDASYILKDWFLSGNIQGAIQQIYLIWSHQLSPNKEKVIYGRGSPEMDFLPEVAGIKKKSLRAHFRQQYIKLDSLKSMDRSQILILPD